MKPESVFVDVGGLRLHLRDWGGNGPPLVLLHGLASNSRIWDLVAPLLAGRFRVLAVDQRGHGLSDKPHEGYDFATLVADLEALQRELRLRKPALVGHSWGANVALQFAVQRPEEALGLVLVDGGFLEISAMDGMTWERTRELMAPPPLAGMELDTFLQGARHWPGLAEIWDDSVREIVLANFRIEDGRIYPHLTRENHLKILRALWEQKPSLMWERVRTPVLLMPAAQDHKDARTTLWMEHKRRGVALAQERSPRVRVQWMENTIHDVPLQRPREMARVIEEFLAGLP